jgi:hypothetical protein
VRGNPVNNVTSPDEEDDTGNNQEIPEFPTLALPVMAILGLAFMFQRRKE